MIDSLQLACLVCESGAVLERYRHIIFEDGTLRAFNGIVSFEANSDLDPSEHFAVNESKLAVALRACEGKGLKVSVNKEFLVFKQNKLTIRVRKIDPDAVFSARLVRPSRDARAAAGNLLEALKTVAPFVSSDASRPWSVAVLLRDNYAWSTNNLSIVRSPVSELFDARIPGAVVPLLCMLPAIDWLSVNKELQTITVGCKRSFVAFPSSQGEWPDVNKFFTGHPKKLPLLDEDLLDAAKTVEKFADRFVTLNDSSVEGKSATIESEYQVEVKKGKGTYSARLLSLILTYAKRADFSHYPSPIPFSGDELEGIAVGVAPAEAAKA